MRRAIGSALLLTLVSASAHGFEEPPHQPVTATLIAEHASVQPGGQTRVGVLFELEEGWHIYGQNPGDAGLPTHITWRAPAGVSMDPLAWPPVEEFLDPGDLRTFGYSGAVVLASRLRAPAKAEGTLPIEAGVRWLACKEICIPGAATLTLSLPVTDTRPVLSTHAQLFDHTGG
jgi:thiol:disulfide interchange protein DsbD